MSTFQYKATFAFPCDIFVNIYWMVLKFVKYIRFDNSGQKHKRGTDYFTKTYIKQALNTWQNYFVLHLQGAKFEKDFRNKN